MNFFYFNLSFVCKCLSVLIFLSLSTAIIPVQVFITFRQKVVWLL